MNTKEQFLVANREVRWLLGGISIAASWIWAPALFVSIQMAYESGLAGIFWFTAPNIVALALFAYFGPRIRNRMPEGFTLPEYMFHVLKSRRIHRVYTCTYFFYQLMAVTVQLFAGGNLVSLLTGIPIIHAMIILLLIALLYTLISGLQASIITDSLQIFLIVSIGALLLPFAWQAAGGFDVIAKGFGGVQRIPHMFDSSVAFSFGIVTSIGLIAGAMSDQQYWQRAFAIRSSELVPAFLFGALLFGLIPIALSSLGFIAANPELNIAVPEGIDTSMIGVQVIATLLPSWSVLLFCLMLLAGLSSTLDSGLSAASSLWVVDMANPQSEDEAIRETRKAIVGTGVIGFLIALLVLFVPSIGLRELWWIFNTVAACTFAPTVLSLTNNNLSEKGAFWSIVIAFIIGLPLFVAANIMGNSMHVVGVSLCIIAITTAGSLLGEKSRTSFTAN